MKQNCRNTTHYNISTCYIDKRERRTELCVRFLFGGNVARDFAKGLYSSKRWQDCRNGYAKSRGWLCENCLRSGLYVPGEIVHHKIELTPQNINNPDIALSWDNLELLCRRCHAERHPTTAQKKNKDGRIRYKVGMNGEIFPL